MRPETEAKVRTVQKFGRVGRFVSGFLGVLLAIAPLLTWGRILSGPTRAGVEIGLGPYTIAGEQLVGAPIKAWALVVATMAFVLGGWTLYHLYCLFDRLAAGSIYTKPTVWHLRQLALLSIAAALFQPILAAISFALAELGFLDLARLTPVDANGNIFFLGPSLGGLTTAALILLAAWIMDVGREVSEDAEAMRREADLVI
jgi:hypothetical protein